MEQTHKEKTDFHIQHGLVKPEARRQIVMDLANDLIHSLYKPVKGTLLFRVDSSRIKAFKIDDTEPINWGDLKCREVNEVDDCYEIVIDEAAPDECSTFCIYIETFMRAWGWNVTVKTEW